jgi:uncharacterized protein DUF5615
VRLLLDEMMAAVAAEHLRRVGHDVVAVQDPDSTYLRGLDDCRLLAHAHEELRAIVTDNVPDFYRCHQQRVAAGRTHHGLLFFTNDTFPRHRHDVFVRHLVAALEREFERRPGDDASSWIGWLHADA